MSGRRYVSVREVREALAGLPAEMEVRVLRPGGRKAGYGEGTGRPEGVEVRDVGNDAYLIPHGSSGDRGPMGEPRRSIVAIG